MKRFVFVVIFLVVAMLTVTALSSAWATTYGPNYPLLHTIRPVGTPPLQHYQITEIYESGLYPWGTLNGAAVYNDQSQANCPLTSPTAVSRWISFSHFGFNIPANKTITGILVEGHCWKGPNSYWHVYDNHVVLTRNRVVVAGGADRQKVADAWLMSSGTWRQWGGTGDLWGRPIGEWTPANVNTDETTVDCQTDGNGIGVDIQVKGSTDTSGFNIYGSAVIDAIRITIYTD